MFRSPHRAFAPFVALLAVVALTAAPAFAASPTTGDFGAHFIETTMNGAFIQVGYSKVKSSTHKVTSIVPTGSGVIVTADLTFAVNAQLFSGSGTYTFGQSGAVQTIVVDASVANVDGSRLIDFDYTSVNDLANLQLDEDLTVYQTGGAVSLYSVDKTKNLVLTGNQEVRTITATVDRDGDVDNVWISQVTDEITPSNFARSTLYQSNARSAQVDYSMTFSADDEMSVSFSRYDVIEGGRSYSLDPGSSSYVNTSKATATAYDTSYRLALVNDSTGKVWRATSSGTAQIGLGEAFTEGGGWSWKAFGKSTATGAAGGAAGGAVVGGISTDSAAPIGAGAGAAVGAVGGAVGGAAAYTAGKLWDWAFGCDDDDEAATASCGGPVPHQPIDHRKPGADERTVVVIGPIQPITPIGSFSTGNSTYFSGHADFSHFEWDVTGTAK